MLIYHLAKPEYFRLKHQSRDFENKIENKIEKLFEHYQ